MVVFYPDFQNEQQECLEVVLVLDLSNSMKGEPSRIAKTGALLALDLLHESRKPLLFNVVVFGSGKQTNNSFFHIFYPSCTLF